MLIDAGVDIKGLKKSFGDVLGAVEAWCRKNKGEFQVVEYLEDGYRGDSRMRTLNEFSFVRPEKATAADIGELIGVMDGKYVVDSRVLRIHISRRPKDKEA